MDSPRKLNPSTHTIGLDRSLNASEVTEQPDPPIPADGVTIGVAKQQCETLGLSRMKWEVQTDNLDARRFYDNLGARYYEKGVFAWDWSE